MPNESAMPADSVSEVLEMARMRQLSGRLTIKQQGHGSIQEGELYVQEGQPVSVRLGSMIGQEALTWLVSWRNVQYIFQPDEPDTIPPGLLVGHGKDVPSYPAQSDRDYMAGIDVSLGSSPVPGLPWPVPHRRDVGRDVLTLPLTRRQRVMYLLIDGHRTFSDPSRCCGKTLQEVELIVRELQAQGLADI